MSIKIKRNGVELDHKFFLFPAGEVGVKLDVNNLKVKYMDDAPYDIYARVHNSNDFMELMMIADALSIWNPSKINLYLYYIPYGRQDRVCVPGESFSIDMFLKLLMTGNHFDKILTVDPHSEVSSALLQAYHKKYQKNTVIISRLKIIQDYPLFSNRISKGVKFIAPDAGSNKKTAEIAGYFGHSEFIRADKLRDLSNGNIKETIVYADDLKGSDIVIIDDLAEGGKTFIELAKVLKKKNAGKIILYVTHSIFSKGTKILFENGIDEIFTTNSYFDTWPANVELEKINVLDLEKRFIL